MRTGISLVIATLALWLWTDDTARACSCVPPDYNRDYQNAEHVVRAHAIASLGAANGQRSYLALTVGDAYKGCLREHSLVIIRTASDSAACGYELQPGDDYLLHGDEVGQFWGAPILRVSLCSGNSAWSELPADHLAYLDSRYVCCGEDCGCRLDNDVQCLVNPCDVSSCTVEGATCNANYCGGCNAEWTDASGGRVCLPEVPATEEGL
jgi:hypothetical protein